MDHLTGEDIMENQPIIRASDLMERNVITVTPETSVLDLHQLFVEEQIHGAPVVDHDGLVQGVVSTLDLLRIVRDEVEPGAGSTATTYFRDELSYSGPDWIGMPEDFQDRMQQLTAADAMTRELVIVRPDATVDEIVRAMSENRVHRVLVGEGRRLQGVITTFDLMRVLSRVNPVFTIPTRYTGCRRADVK